MRPRCKFSATRLELLLLLGRYNISTADYPAWDADAALSRQVDTYSRFGFPSKAAAAQRGYVFKNNPKVRGLGVWVSVWVGRAATLGMLLLTRVEKCFQSLRSVGSAEQHMDDVDLTDSSSAAGGGVPRARRAAAARRQHRAVRTHLPGQVRTRGGAAAPSSTGSASFAPFWPERSRAKEAKCTP